MSFLFYFILFLFPTTELITYGIVSHQSSHLDHEFLLWTYFLPSGYHIVCTKYIFLACTTRWIKEFLKFTAVIVFTQLKKTFRDVPSCFILGFGEQKVCLLVYFLSKLSIFRSHPQISTFHISKSQCTGCPQSKVLFPHQFAWLKNGGHYVLLRMLGCMIKQRS